MAHKNLQNPNLKDCLSIIIPSFSKPISIGSMCLRNYIYTVFYTMGCGCVRFLDKCSCSCCAGNHKLQYTKNLQELLLGSFSFVCICFDNAFFAEEDLSFSLRTFIEKKQKYINFDNYFICNKEFLLDFVSRETHFDLSNIFSIKDCCEKQSNSSFKIISEEYSFNAEQIFQRNTRSKLVKKGVQLMAPETFFCSQNVFIEGGVKIHQNVNIMPETIIESGCEILPFTFLKNAAIESEATIGPFASIVESKIGSASVVGNFVEIKRSNVRSNVKIKHLSYIGDSDIGENVNIGAGCVVCNYDGVFKHKTTVGRDSFIGSNSCLVAPLDVGKNSIIAAGSVITKSVSASSVAIGRAEQQVIENKANALRRIQRNKYISDEDR